MSNTRLARLGYVACGHVCKLYVNYKQGRQFTCKSNIEALSRKRCYRGKEMSILHSKLVSAALVNQQAMRKRHIVVCGLAGSTMFLHVIL